MRETLYGRIDSVDSTRRLRDVFTRMRWCTCTCSWRRRRVMETYLDDARSRLLQLLKLTRHYSETKSQTEVVLSL